MPFTFQKDSITIQAPLDCSTSLADASFANPIVAYNSAGSAALDVNPNGFVDIFT